MRVFFTPPTEPYPYFLLKKGEDLDSPDVLCPAGVKGASRRRGHPPGGGNAQRLWTVGNFLPNMISEILRCSMLYWSSGNCLAL